MPGRFVNPYPQYEDSTPAVYSGGSLSFYASGTSTPLNTYTTTALSVANPNPIVLNSAGRPAVDIFLQDLNYKVVLKDANGSTIWTADPVFGRDSNLIAKTITGSGSPSGVVAGTAGSASILPDFYWDYTNSILYVCTTTGIAATAVWTAVNASSATPSVPQPQGRLTLTSATPVLAADTLSATAVYYTPYIGSLVPIYNGASMTPTDFSEITLTLSASHSANVIYDIFVFSNSGVLTLATGPAWTTSTAGSGSRGTGAGTTQLARIKGLLVNAVSITGRNGATTYTIGANLATYLGSVFIDATAGQVSCTVGYGQNRKWGVWNAYNRCPVLILAGDTTATWTYATNTIRAGNNVPSSYSGAFFNYGSGTSVNGLSVFTGLAEEFAQINLAQLVTGASNGTPGFTIGIGLNSTTAYVSGSLQGQIYLAAGGVGASTYVNAVASHQLAPSLGINNLAILEQCNAASSTTVHGTASNTNMTAQWRA